ncbi:MAG TPA: hypothetical protein VGK67_36850 [Myxococcales bacterium]|jgi:hypothetical protein
MRITRWDDEEMGPLSEEAAQRRFHRSLYEVAIREVAESVRVSGDAPRRTLIGLSGAWLLEAEGQRALVKPGDVVEVASGKFTFETSGPVRYLAVYPLPPDRVVN